MKTYTLDDVAVLIDKYNDLINFGTAEYAPDDILIEKAEKTLGLQFTSSYKNFLKNYGGGEIGYEVIFSIYKASFEGCTLDDIVYYHITDIEKSFCKVITVCWV
ncbi:hypothetical protein GCM10023262_03920 [Bartonella pachyuromydis]|uniref:Knr4/Smi1-like domain-containing protein n=1 Tax=Bartonella pachyuromydis TaxID=931097 RepID=A0ABP8VC21_9HYPH